MLMYISETQLATAQCGCRCKCKCRYTLRCRCRQRHLGVLPARKVAAAHLASCCSSLNMEQVGAAAHSDHHAVVLLQHLQTLSPP